MISSFKKITQSQKKRYIHIILGISILFFAIGIGILSYFAHIENTLENKIYPNIFIDGTAVGEQTKQDARDQIDDTVKNLSPLAYEVLYKDSPVATLSATDLGIRWNGNDVLDDAYKIGRGKKATSRLRYKLQSLLGWERHYLETAYIYDSKKTDAFISSISAQYNRAPKNARFEVTDGRVSVFREDTDGTAIDTKKFIRDTASLVSQLNTESYNPQKETISLSENVIKAEVTLAKANDLGIEELISVGKSDYTGSIPSRIHNLTLATSKFHGVIVPQGEELSFNEIIGDISINTGYQQAYIIQNGKTVLGDGGGVCQVSTTLFRAGLNAGLPITERTAHAYRVGYYENDSQPGFDATIYSPIVDLKMQNDTPADILIQTEINEDTSEMYIKFYGSKDNRDIHISEANVYDIAPAPPAKHEDDPTLARGVVKQIDFAAPGAKASFTYNVTRDGEVLQDETFFSSYKPWAAVYLVGTKD